MTSTHMQVYCDNRTSYISVMTTPGEIVMDLSMLMYLVLVENICYDAPVEQVLGLAIANTFTGMLL